MLRELVVARQNMEPRPYDTLVSTGSPAVDIAGRDIEFAQLRLRRVTRIST